MATLTYEILGRPEAIRPIPGETVVFTCEVQGETLTWDNTVFGTVSFIRVNNPAGDVQEDANTGKEHSDNATYNYCIMIIHVFNNGFLYMPSEQS